MDKMMTIVFIAYDGYNDLWEDCINLFRKFWPDCPYQVMFVNNEKEVQYTDIKVIHTCKNAEWSCKAQIACENIDTPYICLLLEDFFFGAPIDTEQIKDSVSLIHKEKLRYYKLVNMNRAVKNHDSQYHNYNFLHIIPESDEYGVSLQAAIWKKEYLQQLLGTENYNAWIFEFDRVRDAQGKPNTATPGCVFDNRNILHLQHGVIQGKYLPGTIRYFNNLGIHLNVERPIMSFSHYYKLRLQSKAKYCIPKGMRGAVKHFMEKMGFKFVSTIRDK